MDFNNYRTSILLLLFVTYSQSLDQNLEVTIDQGTLRGTYDTTVLGRQFFSFTGIPYAEPPLGKLRFMEPQQHHKWEGVLNATFYGARCIQYNHFTYTVIGSEDCLTINVFSPKLPVGKNISSSMDVIIYIHGGAFMFGSGENHTPHFLLDNDVVFVTLNYRVGPLGFLSTEDEVVPGNNGLKDQVIALKWIQKNIAAFGGNPDSVTLIGSSAGGASVHYHYLSPLSKGLFHKGFSSSGTVLSTWAMMKRGKQKTEQIGQALGCSTSNTTSLIQCLQDKPAYDIVIQSKQLMGWLYNPYSPFAPTIEKWGHGRFLDQDPLQLLQEGKFQNLPWMTSVVSEEGLYPGAEFIASSKYLQELDEKWQEILPHVLDFNYTVPNELKKGISSKIRSYYLGNQTVPENTAQMIQMIGDRLFVSSAVEAAKKHAFSIEAPVYFYYFSYRGNSSLSERFFKNNNNYGVSHADDIGYFIKTTYLHPEISVNDTEMSKEFLNLICSFAKNG